MSEVIEHPGEIPQGVDRLRNVADRVRYSVSGIMANLAVSEAVEQVRKIPGVTRGETVARALGNPHRLEWNAEELKKFDNRAHAVAAKAVPIFVEGRVHGIEYDFELGAIPKEGPVLIVYNHPGVESTLIVPTVVQELTDRPTTMVVKHTLSDPNAVESDAMRQKTKKKGLLNPTKPGGLVRKGIAHAVNKAANAIPVNREKPERKTFEDIDEALRNGLVVAMSLTTSRQDENDLTNPMEGVAKIMQDNPDVPVVIMAMTNVTVPTPGRSEKSAYVSLSHPVTMRDLDPTLSKSKKVRALAHDYIVSGMRELVARQIPQETIKQ